tara:strand:- start:99 stop:743 length:645 start_codon:yes stop_codon:yes gene_type:complete
MQFKSSIFSYEGNIYKYGGYGFFSVRNFIVMYDFDSNEWESVQNNNDLLPPGRFDNGFFVRNDKLYVVGGTTVNEYDRENKIELDDLWSFSLNLNKWEKIGNNNFFKFFKTNSFNFHNNIITKKNNRLYLLNIDNNIINTYESNNTFIKMIYKKQYDRTHNIRLKNNLLDNLNSKIQLLIKNNLNRLIYSKPSEYDKRYKSYFLKLSNFKMLFK